MKRQRWLSREKAIMLRDRIIAELGYPSDLISIEQAWIGEDGGTIELLTGFRVVLALPFPNDKMPEVPVTRVRNIGEARSFARRGAKWDGLELAPLGGQWVVGDFQALKTA